MLLQTDNMNETISTIQSEKIDFTVDEKALNHIMSVLTNLYSDPISSVVREIATNAFDSHLISGQTRPVEIFTPSRLSQNLVIQDFGAGMSADDIRNLYSRYGASTKRGNNIEAGQLGLGSKSPFAYTDQFTIVAVKNGEKTTAILGRNASGSAEINIVSVSSTTESNGVKMTIPVKSSDIYTFNNAITDFVKYAEPGLVVVDSARNTERDSWVDLGEGFFVVHEYNNSKVVMGNVSYPLGRLDWTNEISIVHYCGMGEVTFAPSREELIHNAQTKTKLEWIKETGRIKVDKYIRDLAAQVSTTYDKYNLALKYQRWSPRSISLSSQSYPSTMYRTVVVPRYMDSPASTNELGYTNLVRYQTDITVMRNFKSQRWTRLHSNKVLEKDLSLGGKFIVLFDAADDAVVKDLFGSGVKFLDWDDFRSIKVPTKKVERKPKFAYEGFSRRERDGIDDIRTYEKVLYVSKTSFNNTSFGATHLKKNECVVFVPRSSQDDFIKRFDAESFLEVCRKRQEHVKNCLKGKKITRTLMNTPSCDSDFITMLKLSDRITNQEFVNDARLVAKYHKWDRISRKWKVYMMPRASGDSHKYLLMRGTSASIKANQDHLIIYINALEEK